MKPLALALLLTCGMSFGQSLPGQLVQIISLDGSKMPVSGSSCVSSALIYQAASSGNGYSAGAQVGCIQGIISSINAGGSGAPTFTNTNPNNTVCTVGVSPNLTYIIPNPPTLWLCGGPPGSNNGTYQPVTSSTGGGLSGGTFLIGPGASSATIPAQSVTSSNQISVMQDNTIGASLGVTCYAAANTTPIVTARSAGVGFSVSAVAPVGTSACYDYTISAPANGSSVGTFTMPAGSNSTNVTSGVVTSTSKITVTQDDSLGASLGVTCYSAANTIPLVTARTPGVGFTVTAVAPVALPGCYTFTVN